MLKITEKDLTLKSTIRTESYAKYYALINNLSDIKEAINFIKSKKISFKIIGNGSNILFSKKYYDDILLMQLGDSFKKIKFYNNYVEIGGSYSLIQAGRKLINAGYGDYIFFNLIPATIGGAVRQNAGTGQGEEIKDVYKSCLVYDIKESRTKELTLKELEFDYRASIIKKYPNRYIIISAKFKLNNKNKNIEKLVVNMKNRVKEKLEREPKGYCFGSTFVNNKMSAWKYVDSIYKELSQNKNVHFSKKHKNWIINNGASGKEIKNLIENAKKLINKKFGITIRDEVDII